MTPLATLEAFAEFRQVAYDAADVFALRALESASVLIRAALAQQVNLVTDDVIRIDGLGLSGLVLPQIPVIEITDVTLLHPSADDQVLAATDYYVDGAGILWRSPECSWGWGWGWVRPRGNVQVTYTHGYETLPDEAVTLCCMVASRLLATSVSAGSTISSQTIGGASVTYEGTSGTTNSRGLTAEEDALLRAYPWPAPVAVEAS